MQNTLLNRLLLLLMYTSERMSALSLLMVHILALTYIYFLFIVVIPLPFVIVPVAVNHNFIVHEEL